MLLLFAFSVSRRDDDGFALCCVGRVDALIHLMFFVEHYSYSMLASTGD